MMRTSFPPGTEFFDWDGGHPGYTLPGGLPTRADRGTLLDFKTYQTNAVTIDFATYEKLVADWDALPDLR